MSDRDNIPTIMITTPDNYLVLVGEAKTISGRLVSQYVKKGFTVKTVPFKDYLSALKEGMKWVYDKPKNSTL